MANVFDAAGDTLLTQALLGNGPLALTPQFQRHLGHHCQYRRHGQHLHPLDHSADQEHPEQHLAAACAAKNLLSTASNLFITEPNVPAVAVLTNNSSGVYQLTQELPVPASPINLAGNANAARVYSITQDNGSNTVAFGDCENPSQVTTPGQVQSIEISTVTISRTLPVGICPVYGIGSTDNNRMFILNRGSGTVTVINSQFNTLDTTPNLPNFDSATGTLLLPPPAGVPAASFNAGPVFADYYAPASQLVTANYDSNTITIINTSLDQFGNDSALFGQAVTVPVGNGPATLTILRDGSRVYVANQKDSTVSVVSLTSFQVLATIPVTGHPISIASTYSTPYGQIYVLSSDQPLHERDSHRHQPGGGIHSVGWNRSGCAYQRTVGSRQQRHDRRGYQCHQRQSCQRQRSTLWFRRALCYADYPRCTAPSDNRPVAVIVRRGILVSRPRSLKRLLFGDRARASRPALGFSSLKAVEFSHTLDSSSR